MLSEERPYEKCARLGADSLSDVKDWNKGRECTGSCQEAFLSRRRYTATSQSPSSKLDKRRTAENQWNRKSKGYSDLMPLRAFQENVPAFSQRRSGFFKTGYNCSILYGRYALLQAGAFETADAEYAFQTDRRKRELFIEALQKNAVYIILLHNHPSGDPMPSREDILVTQRIREGGSLLGIELLDHIIIGDNCYVSLAEQKLLKEK